MAISLLGCPAATLQLSTHQSPSRTGLSPYRWVAFCVYTLRVVAIVTMCIGKGLLDQPWRGVVAILIMDGDEPSVQLAMW
jgi:hypothetical protein